MNVNELKIFLETISNKDQSGDSLSPAEYNSLLARGNERLFRDEYKFFQENQEITDALEKFLTPLDISVSGGYYSLPANYVHESSVTFISNGITKVVTMVTEEELNNIRNHPTKVPTLKYPYGTFINGKIEVLPTSISQIHLVYLRMPTTPVWGYTISNDEPVYDSTTSTQMEWDSIYHLKMAQIILSYMGIDFRDNDLQAYAERAKADS